MKTKNAHYGELMIDHRSGPGLPEDFYRAMGVDLPRTPGGTVIEVKTITCSHCNTVFVINPLRQRERSYCGKCDHYICDACDFVSRQPDYVHLSFEGRVEVVLESATRNTPLPLQSKD